MEPLLGNTVELKSALGSLLKLRKNIGSLKYCDEDTVFFMLSARTLQICIAYGGISCRYFLAGTDNVEHAIREEEVCFFGLEKSVAEKVLAQLVDRGYGNVSLDAIFDDATRTKVTTFILGGEKYPTKEGVGGKTEYMFKRLHEICLAFTPRNVLKWKVPATETRLSSNYDLSLSDLWYAAKVKYEIKNSDLERKMGLIQLRCGREGLHIKRIELAQKSKETVTTYNKRMGKLKKEEKTVTQHLEPPKRKEDMVKISFSGQGKENTREPFDVWLNVQFLVSVIRTACLNLGSKVADTKKGVLFQATDTFEPVHISNDNVSILLMGVAR